MVVLVIIFVVDGIVFYRTIVVFVAVRRRVGIIAIVFTNFGGIDERLSLRTRGYPKRNLYFDRSTRRNRPSNSNRWIRPR